MELGILLVFIGFFSIIWAVLDNNFGILVFSVVLTSFLGLILFITDVPQNNIRCVSEIDSNDIKTYNNCEFDRNVIKCEEFRISIPNGYRCSIEKQMEKQ